MSFHVEKISTYLECIDTIFKFLCTQINEDVSKEAMASIFVVRECNCDANPQTIVFSCQITIYENSDFLAS